MRTQKPFHDYSTGFTILRENDARGFRRHVVMTWCETWCGVLRPIAACCGSVCERTPSAGRLLQRHSGPGVYLTGTRQISFRWSAGKPARLCSAVLAVRAQLNSADAAAANAMRKRCTPLSTDEPLLGTTGHIPETWLGARSGYHRRR